LLLFANLLNETRAIRQAVVRKKFDNVQHFKEIVEANDLDEIKYTCKVAELLNVSQ